MFRRPRITAVLTIISLIITAGFVNAAPSRIGSITENVKSPVHVAVDEAGNIYVAETSRDKVNIYDRKGKQIKSFGVPRPLGIAVDSEGRIYVGSVDNKAVYVYNADLSYSHSLGSGDGEVSKPNTISIDSSGRIYVVDGIAEKVKVYEPGGAPAFSFGGTGNTDGLFNKPTALVINEAAGELYVSDLQLTGTGISTVNGARIQAFDKSGTYKRSFGQYGSGTGQITLPIDSGMDKAGKLYVVDSYQKAALIFDPATGAFQGGMYDTVKPLATPSGIAIGKNNAAYIASYSGDSVDIYALDGYTTLETDPKTLSFQTRQLSPTPPDNQTIVITNTGTGILSWTASADKTWLALGQTTGTTGPGTSVGLTVGVNASGLGAATHTGNITITADGLKDTIPVTLTVLPAPVLTLSNGWLNFSAKKGKSPASQQVTINIQNAATNWSAASSDPGIISISPAAGNVTTTAGISINASGLAAGSHTGYITFTAPNAVGNNSKLTISITVTAGNKITVTTNKQEARYSIKGPDAAYTGSGASWTKEDVPAGEYTVTYDNIAGHQRPLPQTKKITEDGEIAFSGIYESHKDLASKKNILTAKGPSKKNNSETKAFKPDGTATTPQYSLTPLDTTYGANIAIGDVDGDGTAEIIAAAGPGEANTALVRVYSKDKTKLTEFTPYSSMYGANIAAADLNADGQAEIIVAPGPGETNPGTVTVYAFDKDKKAMIKTGIELTAHEGYYGAVITTADTEGDQKPEIITAPGGKENADKITVWTIDTSKGIADWTAKKTREITITGKHQVSLAGGDIDADAKDEIITASREPQGDDSAVRIYRLEGTEYKETKKITIASGHRITVAATDLDGDGQADIIAGAYGNTDAKKEDDDEEDDDEDGKTKKDDDDKNKADHKKDDDDKHKADHKKAQSNQQQPRVTIYYSASGAQKTVIITPYDHARKGINVAAGAMGIQ